MWKETFNPPLYPKLEVELTLAGWSASKFGDYLGLTPVAISERLRGKREFKLEEMLMTSELFNKSVNELFVKNNEKG